MWGLLCCLYFINSLNVALLNGKVHTLSHSQKCKWGRYVQCTYAFDANFHGFWHGFRAVNTTSTSTLCLYSRVYDWFWLHFTWALKGAHLNNQKLRPKNRLPHILNTSKELRLHIIFWMNTYIGYHLDVIIIYLQNRFNITHGI